jgi:hypothetical protein
MLDEDQLKALAPDLAAISSYVYGGAGAAALPQN